MNEVKLVVTTENNTKAGFDKAKADAHKAAADLEKELSGIPVTVDDKTEPGLDKAKANVEKTVVELEGELDKIPITANDKMAPELAKAEAEAEVAGEKIKRSLTVSPKVNPWTGKDGFLKSILPVAAAAAPLLAPVAAGSLLGILGAGGLAVGIAAQFNAPAVASARARFKTDTSAAIHDATASFAPELAASVGILDQGVTSFFAGVKPGLDALAPELTTISTEISGGLAKAGPILADAFAKSKPVVDEVGTSISLLIVDSAKMFDGMSMGADGEAKALHAVTSEVGSLLVGLGNVLGVAGKVFDVIATGEKKVADAFDKHDGAGSDILKGVKQGALDVLNPLAAVGDGWNRLTKAWNGDQSDHAAASLGSLTHGLVDYANTLGGVISAQGLVQDSTGKLVPDYAALATQMSATKQTADTLAGAMADSVFKTLMGNDLATLHWEESLTALSKALKKNKDALDIHKGAGQADREAILGAVQANIQQYDTMIQSGMSAKQAADAYDANAAALRKQLHAAGLTKHQIDDLIGSYDKVPDTVNTTIALEGIDNAIQQLVDLQKQLNGLYVPSLALTIQQGHDIYGGGGDQGSGRSSGGGHAKPKPPAKKPPKIDPRAQASGGPGGGWTWVGEQGAELLRLPQGSTVYPHGQSEQMAASGGGGGHVHATLAFAGGANDAFATFLMKMFREKRIQLKVQVNGRSVPVTV